MWAIVVSSVLMGNHWGSVMVFLVSWSNIGIMFIINMDFSSVVVWLKVDIMSNSVAFNSMDWSISMVWSLMTERIFLIFVMWCPVIIMMSSME